MELNVFVNLDSPIGPITISAQTSWNGLTLFDEIWANKEVKKLMPENARPWGKSYNNFSPIFAFQFFYAYNETKNKPVK